MKGHSFDSPPASGKALDEFGPPPNRQEVCFLQAGTSMTPQEAHGLNSLSSWTGFIFLKLI